MDTKASVHDTFGVLGQDESGRDQCAHTCPGPTLDIFSRCQFAAKETETDEDGRQFRSAMVGMPRIPPRVASDGKLNLGQTNTCYLVQRVVYIGDQARVRSPFDGGEHTHTVVRPVT